MFVSLRRAIHLAPRGHFGTAINVSAASSVGIPQRLRENAAAGSAFCGTALCRSGVDGVERHLSLIYGQSVMDLLPGMARSSPQKNSFASPPKMFRGRRRRRREHSWDFYLRRGQIFQVNESSVQCCSIVRQTRSTDGEALFEYDRA